MAPFPIPARRTGRAGLPHPALQRFSSHSPRWQRHLHCAIKLTRERPRWFGFQAHRQSPSSRLLLSTPPQGPFPPPAFTGFSGTMTLSDSCPGRRLSRRCGTSRPQDRSPTLPVMPSRRAVPITPADRKAARVGRFALRAAFPVLGAGRHPQLHFRGLLRVHSRYGPPFRSTAQGGLCREASIRPVAQPNRSPATRLTDSFLDGTLIHWHHAPSWRTQNAKPAKRQARS